MQPIGPVDTTKPFSVVSVNHPCVVVPLRRAPLPVGEHYVQGDARLLFRHVRERRLLTSGVVSVNYYDPSEEKCPRGHFSSQTLGVPTISQEIVVPHPMSVTEGIVEEVSTEVIPAVVSEPIRAGVPVLPNCAEESKVTPEPPKGIVEQLMDSRGIDYCSASPDSIANLDDFFILEDELLTPVAAAPLKRTRRRYAATPEGCTAQSVA